MLNLFKELVRAKNPDYILSLDTETSPQVSAVTCKWCKDGQYWMAQSFYTDAWVARTIFPIAGAIVQSGCSLQLEDVANIRVFNDFESCNLFPAVNVSTISMALKSLNEKVTELLGEALCPIAPGDTMRWTITLSPCTTILVTVSNCGRVVGNIAIIGGSKVIPCFVCDERIYEYAVLLERQTGQLATPMITDGGCVYAEQ